MHKPHEALVYYSDNIQTRLIEGRENDTTFN